MCSSLLILASAIYQDWNKFLNSSQLTLRRLQHDILLSNYGLYFSNTTMKCAVVSFQAIVSYIFLVESDIVKQIVEYVLVARYRYMPIFLLNKQNCPWFWIFLSVSLLPHNPWLLKFHIRKKGFGNCWINLFRSVSLFVSLGDIITN